MKNSLLREVEIRTALLNEIHDFVLWQPSAEDEPKWVRPSGSVAPDGISVFGHVRMH